MITLSTPSPPLVLSETPVDEQPTQKEEPVDNEEDEEEYHYAYDDELDDKDEVEEEKKESSRMDDDDDDKTLQEVKGIKGINVNNRALAVLAVYLHLILLFHFTDSYTHNCYLW